MSKLVKLCLPAIVLVSVVCLILSIALNKCLTEIIAWFISLMGWLLAYISYQDLIRVINKVSKNKDESKRKHSAEIHDEISIIHK